jgi:hypothetical protein
MQPVVSLSNVRVKTLEMHLPAIVVEFRQDTVEYPMILCLSIKFFEICEMLIISLPIFTARKADILVFALIPFINTAFGLQPTILLPEANEK